MITSDQLIFKLIFNLHVNSTNNFTIKMLKVYRNIGRTLQIRWIMRDKAGNTVKLPQKISMCESCNRFK